MSGHYRPLTCCDRDCALVNGCREGGYQCERCGRWFCGSEIKENLCENCAEEAAKEREQEEESEENNQ